MTAAAPYSRIPLYVRAGSIIPLGPPIEYIGEKPADPVTLLVYAGASGHGSLDEDDGLTYASDRGAFTRIGLQWDDAQRRLTIGAREGAFPGMLRSRHFHVVIIGPGHPAALGAEPAAGLDVAYDGRAVSVR